MGDTLKLIQTAEHGMSDTVQLAIVSGIVAVATYLIKGIIEAHAEKAKTLAALEAAKVTAKLNEVEIKIDGRLSQLLELAKKEAEERGHRLGKEEGKKEETDRKQEAPPVPATPPVEFTGATKLKIVEGEIKVKPSEEKKKPSNIK